MGAGQVNIEAADIAYVKLVARGMYRRFRGQIDLDEFVSEGNLALAQCAVRYDPACGASLRTYADKRIRGAMFRFAAGELDRRRPLLYGDLPGDEDEAGFEEKISGPARDPLMHAVLGDICGKVERIASEMPVSYQASRAQRAMARKMPLAIELYMMDIERSDAAARLGFKGRGNAGALFRMVRRGIAHVRRELKIGGLPKFC